MCRHDPRCDGPGTDDPVALQQWRDQCEARTRDIIRTHGWAVEAVFGDHRRRRPDFAYTVGLWGFGHPELLVLGLPVDPAARLLNELGERVRAGERMQAGDEVASVLVHPAHVVQLLRLPRPETILFAAQSTYRRPGGKVVPALQVVYPDSRGRYPWDPAYADTRWMQPLPGAFAA